MLPVKEFRNDENITIFRQLPHDQSMLSNL